MIVYTQENLTILAKTGVSVFLRLYAVHDRQAVIKVPRPGGYILDPNTTNTHERVFRRHTKLRAGSGHSLSRPPG